MASCPDPAAYVEERIDRVLTQYRESPNLLFLARTYLGKVAEALTAICSLPEQFDILTAVGDQLTIIGKRLGFPRCHCICAVQPVFGFACEGVEFGYPIVGFCEIGTWLNCGEFGTSTICIDDDETYRRFLLVRRYQILSLYDIASLTEAIQTMWGETATVLDAGNRRVVIAPGRDLTNDENNLLQVAARILPIAPGIRQRYYFGSNLKVFGFGTGWGGFCEPYLPDGALEGTTAGDNISTTAGDDIITTPLTQGAPWMCEIDVHPYDCA